MRTIVFFSLLIERTVETLMSIWRSEEANKREAAVQRHGECPTAQFSDSSREAGDRGYPDNDGRNKNRVKMKDAKPEGSYSPQGHWCSSEARR